MIFDEEIIEEKYDPRKLPSMIPSYHHDQRIQDKLDGDEINIESQVITTLGNKVVQSEFKIESSNPYEQKLSEHTHMTENEENAPFNYMMQYQHRPPFSFKRSKYNDDQDSKQVEVLQSHNEKYAQGVRSMKVNQNILQSINLAQSQTFYNCMHCYHHHNDQTYQYDKNFHQRDLDSIPYNSKRGSQNNAEKLLDKLRLRCSSQVGQGPLNPFSKGSQNNTSQINTSNSNQTCYCSCHHTFQGHSTYHNHHSSGSSSSKSHQGIRKFHSKFHSSIIDSSQFVYQNSPTQVRETSYSNHNNLKRMIQHPNNGHSHNIRHKSQRAKSMIEIIDNPEIRKKWALTKVIQMNFDAQLTHTLIQSIDYFNLSKEQILDQMLDKLIEFKKYRYQQQLEGSLIQPQISHSDFLKYQQNFKSQRAYVKNDQANSSPHHFQKQSQFFNYNNNINNCEDMSISLPRGNEYLYGRGNGYMYMNKHMSSSPPPHDSIQMSQGFGRHLNVNINQSQHLNGGGGGEIRYAVSPTRSRNNNNNFIVPVQKRAIPKYNFSQIKLSQSNNLYAPVDRTKIRKRSQILQNKFIQETKHGICSVCFEEQLLIQISSRCHHYFCSYCITNYFEEKIAKCDVIEINCLNFQCSNKYTETEVREVVDQSTYQQYLRFKRLIMIRQDQNLRWCIQLDCNGVLKGSTQNPKMQCPVCSSYQCYICQGQWHEGIRCDQAINEEYEKEQLELRKNCPNCRKEVKKSKKCINKSTCRACGHRFCWLCNRKVTPFHFSTWNFFGCPGMININQIPSYYQKMKYKIKALFEYIAQIIIFTILLLLYPIVMLLVSFFLPLLIFFNKNGGTVKYRGTRKCLVVTGLVVLGILFYPLWYLISIVPGLCWFCKKLLEYLRNQKDNSKNQDSDEDIDDDFDIFSQQVTKGNNESGLTKPI